MYHRMPLRQTNINITCEIGTTWSLDLTSESFHFDILFVKKWPGLLRGSFQDDLEWVDWSDPLWHYYSFAKLLFGARVPLRIPLITFLPFFLPSVPKIWINYESLQDHIRPSISLSFINEKVTRSTFLWRCRIQSSHVLVHCVKSFRAHNVKSSSTLFSYASSSTPHPCPRLSRWYFSN